VHDPQRAAVDGAIGINLLFRWFVGMNIDDPVWDATVFSKNRDRLLRADVAALFFRAVLDEANARDLVSDEHFTVDAVAGSLGEPEEFQEGRRRESAAAR
jgi:hypothetical protein